MSRYIEKLEMMTLPTIVLKTAAVFPDIPLSLEISSKADIESAAAANRDSTPFFAVLQRDPSNDDYDEDGLYSVGCVVKIKQHLKLPDGNVRLLAEGLSRARLIKLDKTGKYPICEVMSKTVNFGGESVKAEALVRELTEQFDEFIKYMPKYSNELVVAQKSIRDPALFCDFMASNVLMKDEDKQKIIEEFDPIKRLQLLAVLMGRELRILTTEFDIHKKVRAQIENNQREYYLREQLKAIQNELGYSEDSSDDDEIEEYDEMIYRANLPKEVEEKLLKELRRLSKTPMNSSDGAVIRNYLDICLEIPWSKLTRDRLDIVRAKKILDADHDGLEKVKERILEYLAVKQLNPSLKNQIICLVGPPGTGKTSVGESIARAMKRKYVRVSLGGVRDEADIRGHRKTYVGSMPGRIINAIVQAGVRNPLILLDEIDKLTHNAQGDPASALLEVLDSEQNKSFRDHFIELPIDLSDCVFITTANDLETVPSPLIDRMEIIEMKIYTKNEKLSIAKHHLIKKQLKNHGLNSKLLKFTDESVFEIIDYYTREAGVRNLNREIASICRKVAKKIVEGEIKSEKLTEKNVSLYLGTRKIKPEHVSDTAEIGVVNGLAYTELGGDILKIEALAMPGNGKIELTGSLGDVMKESAKAAVSYIRSRSASLGIEPDFYKTKDIHIHVPEGAVPKDGPSAGVTMVTALASELSGTPVKSDIAMTGEVTLTGKVLPIGGLKEKTMAAYSSGVKQVIIPRDNMCDLDDIDKTARENMQFLPCDSVDEVLGYALCKEKNI